MSDKFNIPIISIDSIIDEAIKSGPLREQNILIIYDHEDVSEQPDILCQVFEILKNPPYLIPLNYLLQKASDDEKIVSEGKYLLDLRKMGIDYQGIENLEMSNPNLQDVVARSVRSYQNYLSSLNRGISLPSTRTFS